MDDTLKALKEDMLAFIDPGVAENDIEHTVSVEHHNFLRWFDALDRLSAQQREPVVRVKELEWEDADEGMCTKWRACALGGHYELVALDGDGGGLAVNFYWGRPLSFWFIQGEPDEWGPTGPKMFPTLDAAKSAAQADYEARIKSALVEVPADAGMREALDIAFCAMKDLRDALHREPSVQGRKWVHLGSSLNYAIRKAELALTAPGATTKSDGGAKAGSSPILASKEEQRPDTHGMMPVGDNAANVGCTGVGPSDPSSTRSDVTVAIIDEALASLEGDAVERAARDNYRLVNYLERLPIKKQLMAGTEVDVVEPQYLLAADRDYIVRILATGLVPDEAAVRADEREKCASEVERRNWPNVGDARRVAAAIRSGGGE